MAVPLIPIGYAVITGVGRQVASKSPQILRNYMLKESSQIFTNDNADENSTEWQDRISKEDNDKETQREKYRALDKQDGTSKHKGTYTDPKDSDPSKSWKDRILDEQSEVKPNNFFRENPLDEVQSIETASLNNLSTDEAQILDMLNDGYTGFSNDNYVQDLTYDYADVSDASDGSADGGADGGGDGGE